MQFEPTYLKSYWLSFTALLFIAFTPAAQGQIERNRYIDEIILPTTYLNTGISSLLDLGYRGFIIDDSSIVDDSVLSCISDFLTTNPKEFLGFIQLETENYQGDLIYSHFMQHIIHVNRQYLPFCDSLLQQNKQILFFSGRTEETKMPAEDYLTFAEVGTFFPVLVDQLFTKYDPSNLFTVFEYHKETGIHLHDSTFINNSLPDAALNFIKKTGKIPNFILSEKPAEVRQFIQNLPLYVKLIVVNNFGEVLSDVRFKKFEHLHSQGNIHIIADQIEFDSTYFFRDNIPLTPCKNGYRFIPEIYTFNYNNYNLYKTIRAHRIDLRNDLVFYLPLSGKELYHSDYPVEILGSTITFINDSEHRKVGIFNGHSSAVYLGSGDMRNMEESFSIALWAMPDSIEGNYPFFSKAGSYCLKIRNGNLCFTVVDIADLVSEKSPIERDRWQHLSLVYEKGSSIKFFINGMLTDLLPVIDYKVVESGFIIGTDQWDEYYSGKMSEILVWNRALGADEVRDMYTRGIDIRGDRTFLGSLGIKLILGFATILIFLISWLLLRRRKSHKMILRTPELSQTRNQGELKNYIRCFGEFAIYDDKGNNLAEKLSSKKRSFVLVVLYYTFSKGGISPKELADTFWPGYHSQRAKNVRGTYIQDIRSILQEDLLAIVYDNKKWRVKPGPEMNCDLEKVLLLEAALGTGNRTGMQMDDTMLETYLDFIGTGRFAEGISDEFTDAVKQEVLERNMDRLEKILKQCSDDSRDDLILRTADVILMIDPIHEEVFKQKLEVLFRLNNIHVAQKCFERFTRSWQQFFDESYQMEFHDLQKDSFPG